MLKKRIIVCLDVKDGRTTKGVKFQNNIDIGDPVEMAKEYYNQGRKKHIFVDFHNSCSRFCLKIMCLVCGFQQRVAAPRAEAAIALKRE